MINNLNLNEEKLRDLHLRNLALGKIYGPLTGYASIDKPWLKYYSEDVVMSDMPKDTIYGYLKEKNKDNMNNIAIEYFGNKLTYKQLIEKIDQTADSLKAMNVKRGDIVTICMPTTPEMVFLFYALSKIGAISNMIDPRKSSLELEEYANEVNSKLFFGIDVAGEKYRNLKKNTTVEQIIMVTPYESFKAPIRKIMKFKDKITSKDKRFIDTNEVLKWDDFVDIRKNSKEKADEVLYEANMPVTIVHTGGTTGKAKGVILSNDNINCCAYQCEISGLDFNDHGTWLDIMPPFIVYGVGNGLHLPLSMNMKVILMPKFDPSKYDEILLKHKPNYMAGVPSHYGYLLSSKKLANVDLSFIKTPIVGGDKMDYTLEKQVNEFLRAHNCQTKIIKGYGMSEVDAAVSVCVTNEANKLKSVGIPLYKCNLGVYNPENGQELTYNNKGEVRISGPNVMIGYYNNDKEEKKILHDENGKATIYSGDLGYFDQDGLLFVEGRYKEMIIRPDGFKVYPSSIEEVILSCDDVFECKVVGCRDYDERQGELPKAFIILKDNSRDKEVVLNEIERLCQEQLAEYSLPYDYQVLDKFPVTAIGKIDTIALKQLENNKKTRSKTLMRKEK